MDKKHGKRHEQIPIVRGVSPRDSEIRKSEMAEMVARMQAAATAAPAHSASSRFETLAAALTPQTKAESWAVLAALRHTLEHPPGGSRSEIGDYELAQIRDMLARGEGLE